MNRYMKFRVWIRSEKTFEVIGLYFTFDELLIGSAWKKLTEYYGEYIPIGKEVSTNRKDKNGIEIYEGDRVKAIDTELNKVIYGVVTYDEEGCDFNLWEEELGFQRAFGISGDEYEIIKSKI